MRSIVRTVGVSFCAINKLLIDAGRVCGEYHDKKIRGAQCRCIQCDEMLLRKIDKKAPKPNRPKRYKTRNKQVVNRDQVEILIY